MGEMNEQFGNSEQLPAPSAPQGGGGVAARISSKLRDAGASLPAPQVTGTVEGAVITGLSIALAVVEEEASRMADWPSCPGCKEGVLYECPACSSNNYPRDALTAQPRTDAAQQGEVVAWRFWHNGAWHYTETPQREVEAAHGFPPAEALYTAPPSAPVVDRDRIGQAISDHLCGLAEDGTLTLDPFDSDNIDAIVDAVVPVLDQRPAAETGAAAWVIVKEGEAELDYPGSGLPDGEYPVYAHGTQQQPAAVDDTRRLEWLVSNKLLVRRLSDTGKWMVTNADLSPAVDGGEYDTPREAIDAGMIALAGHQQGGAE